MKNNTTNQLRSKLNGSRKMKINWIRSLKMSTQNGRKHRIIRILNRNKENKKMITHKSRIYKWNGDRQMDKRICRREREKERVLYDYIICEFMCVFFFPKEISN